ncbi:MAG: uracil-DNA glycosylase [Sulfurimonas sp. CG08_land_8_20_14_0_20_36_33]|nr:MAG: uracil-DNA glycosylase [Sulfurimonas sp. CG23_combo_of_CG06-09_8_20_14_all_36_33]PIS26552.1 MAG: uracil-DNA glycosylase [Sulfurimonas sp. CG08_land_8_20_14_0_20_36_33]PIU34013.1 MAG: uracil-DNA glycosylase [Sulfurimonas sp. CG07_land_8_20_14_0_80_36_56]PIV03841.1 MAG: uracil-DNA glycosylase [Sulfurimonas sp. CG03_land_8_20_14_0_80_36_25]PIV34014.1 MAG: uracil-DNA glycosylase [Sulfurimonas sp. CG02_land_8_20_14_3_00_36_67]PIV61474.1 MAG: uracil-DNA glycosylase [Sulfurimonas sp. CG01_lan
MKKINCRRCEYYFVTWEASQPHGCRAYGFKAPQIPSIVVRQSSGTDCSLFKEKVFSK